MARQPIVLNGMEFKFQKDAIEHFKNMLERYRNGQTIVGKDFNILLALLERHPEADKKIGCGVGKYLCKINYIFTAKFDEDIFHSIN